MYSILRFMNNTTLCGKNGGFSMMKKMFKALLATGLAVLLLGACGNAKKEDGQKESKEVETSADAEKKTDGEKTELLLWMPPFGTEDTLDKEMWKKVLAPFEKENNCNVTVEVIPWSNYEEKYLTAISSGAGPDLGYMYMEMMNDYIDMGALEPFDSYLTDKEKDNFYYLDKGVIDGKQYALPIVVGNARILCYNKKLLEQAGVEKAPETWDEFLAACKKLKDAGITPIQQQWGDASKGSLNSIFFPYLWQAGGDLFSEDGKQATFNSEAGKKAVEFLYSLKKEGYLPDSATSLTTNELYEQFKTGQVAFCVVGTNKGKGFTEAGVDWDYITSLKDKKNATFVAADSLVLLSGSNHKDLAAKMALYMLSGPSMTQFHEMAPFAPVGKDEEYHDSEQFKKIYEEEKDDLHTLPAVKGSAAIYDNLYKNLQLMMLGELSPEEALKESADFANEALAQN